MSEHMITVRAMPLNGHTHRWRCGLPWGKDAVRVRVCENPKPHKLNARGGLEEFSGEISHQDYAELQTDPQIAVSLVGEAGADVHELSQAKAKIADLEGKLTHARRELAGHAEEKNTYRSVMQAEIAEAGAKVAALEGELAVARAQLAEGGHKVVEQLKAELEKVREQLAEKEKAESPTEDDSTSYGSRKRSK